jgi:hypothetical protein
MYKRPVCECLVSIVIGIVMFGPDYDDKEESSSPQGKRAPSNAAARSSTERKI